MSEEDRVTRGEDLRAILALLARYCRDIDEERWEDLRSLITPDCVITILDRTFEGPDAIVDLHKSSDLGKHMLSLPLVEFVGHDTAHVETDQMFFRAPDLIAMVAGSYRDEMRAENGAWKLSRREVIIHVGVPRLDGDVNGE